MLHQANTKNVLVINQASTTAAATASGYVDTKGYDYAKISIIATTANVVSNKPTVLKLQESDTTDNFADVTGFVGGTSFTIPSAITAATSITQPFAVFHVDTRARKRYLNVAVSPATTQSIAVTAELGRAENSPTTSDQATVVVNG